MSDNLRQRTIHGVWWSAIQAGSTRLVQFTVSVALARLLSPEQFGVFGMLGIFLVLSQLFLDSGFGRAIVQRPNLSTADTSSVFYLNLITACVIAGTLCLAAPAIGAFLACPDLVPLARFMSLKLIIGGLSVVQLALLQRELTFKKLTKAALVAGLVSGVVGVLLAYRGFGVWALAWQQVIEATLLMAFVWLLSAWRPSLQFSAKSVRDMFSYGSKLMAGGLLYQGFCQFYRVVIAKAYSPAELGFYSRAVHMQETATLTVNSVISRVTFAVFAVVQNEPLRLKRAMREALCALALVTAPLMFGVLTVGKPLIVALLTDKWVPCVPLFQVLCLAGAFYPLHLINVQFLNATGRSGLNLKITATKMTIQFVIVLATCPWGLLAIVWGQFVSSLIAYLVNSFYTTRLLNYSMREQLSDVFPYYASAAIMAGIMYPLKFIPGLDGWLLLLLQSLSGAVVFLALCHLLRLKAYETSRSEAIAHFSRLVLGTGP